jgi:hypothetical protein
MAAIFLMQVSHDVVLRFKELDHKLTKLQPLGQLCAYGAGLTALQWTKGNSRTDIDMFWR